MINDSTVYTRVEQFKNPLARTKITEWLEYKNEKLVLIKELIDARNRLLEEKEEEQKNLAEYILKSEKRLLELNTITQKLITEACNLEISYISK